MIPETGYKPLQADAIELQSSMSGLSAAENASYYEDKTGEVTLLQVV